MKKIISLLTTAILVLSLCGCDKKTESNDTSGTIGGDNSDVINDEGAENYFGGLGKLQNSANNIFMDENNIYIREYSTLKKLNKKTQILSIACQTPGCTHDHSGCKAYLGGHEKKYCVFNDRLVKIVNERTLQQDGTYIDCGQVYICGGNEKKVFENTPPQELSAEDVKGADQAVVPTVLGDDYLALYSSRWVYILDRDFNIKYTITDTGGYSGGIYYVDNEIYYNNKLYQLIKIDKESGEHIVVDLGSTKAGEGVTDGKTLWFTNGDFSLCSYDPQTGEVKELAPNAVRMTHAGKYVMYMVYNDGKVCVYDTESGEIRDTDFNISNDDLIFDGENYYIYNSVDDVLNQYDESLSGIITSFSLMD